MARTRQQIPTPLDNPGVGVPKVYVHEASAAEQAFASAPNRWSLVRWDMVAVAVRNGHAASVPCPADEVDLAVTHLKAYFSDEECTPAYDAKYDPDSEQLWIWNRWADTTPVPRKE